MKITKFLSICAIALSAFAFTSCSSEIEGTRTFGDFVNYMGDTEDGYSRFVYYNGVSTDNNTDNKLTILSKVSWDSALKPTVGTRVVGYFQIDVNQDLVNNIVLQNAGVIGLSAFGYVQIQAVTPPVSSAPFYLGSVACSGTYLDICALATAKDTQLQLLCDEKSLESASDVADLYLVYTCDYQQDTAETQYFASFDISAVLSHTNIKSIRLVLNNSNGNNDYLIPVRNA